jgi:hypothetical protein
MNSISLVRKVLPAFILLFTAHMAMAQPEYKFANPTLTTAAATHLQPGAVYRFSLVKPGTDALVKVVSVSGGITLNAVDESSTGYPDAFQPFINVGPNTNGYVLFEFSFVQTTTTTLKNQSFVPMTCIDVDGQTLSDGHLYEKDRIELLTGYYDFNTASPSLMVSNMTESADLNNDGTQENHLWIEGRNTHANAYNGIDTAALDVMFSVINSNVSKIYVKIGAMNTSPTYFETRKRSVYFKQFTYQNSFLSVNGLQSFTAQQTNQQTCLQWAIDRQSGIQTMQLEKSMEGNRWASLGSFERNDGSNTTSSINYSYYDDNTSATAYYRLRLQEQNGRITYSDILAVKTGTSATGNLVAYPTVFTGSVTVTFKAQQNETGSLFILDYAGRVVYQQPVRAVKGDNLISLTQLPAQLNAGNYVVTVSLPGQKLSTKIIKK